MKRREHRVGPSLAGRDLADVDHVRARVRGHRDVQLRHRPPDARRSAAGERAHVIAEVNRLCTDLARQPRQLALGAAVADHEPRPALAEGAIEVGEAFEQELGPRPGGVAPAEQAVVEAEPPDHRPTAV